MHTLHRYLVTLICLVSLLAAHAATLVCEGILGNSGEQGESLVRFSAPGASGLGVACDRFSTLWDRGGDGTLNRYALDGRLLAQYKLPRGAGSWNANDTIVLAGESVVILTKGQLYQVPITAPAGSEATSLNMPAERISFSAVGSTIAVAKGGQLTLLNVATGEKRPAGSYTGDIGWVDLGPDLAVYPVVDWKLHKYVNGVAETDGWPKATPGERTQLLNGYWYGHGWHGTIKRFSLDMQPAPGVVLGGASGSFIGHLDQNSELTNGRGMAYVRDNLYAVSGMGGILHLLQWQPERNQLTIVRRIGSVPTCNALGLDRKGNVWYHVGSWQWTDMPDTPIRLGVNGPEEIGQAVMLENDNMVAPGWLWGKPAFYFGALTGEVNAWRIEQACALEHGSIAATSYKDAQGKLVLLAMTKTGKAQSFFIASNGQFQGNAGTVTLQTATPVAAWTTLAMKDANTLLAAGDGAVIEFARDGANWQERRRWSTWGNGNRFGAGIYITADAGRIWVSDRERHRVVVFDAASGAELATFGQADKAGTDLLTLTAPELLAARNDRAVVFDSGNQRLVKLALK